MSDEERTGSPGDVARSSRRAQHERRLPEYIRIVESFGYVVTKPAGPKKAVRKAKGTGQRTAPAV